MTTNSPDADSFPSIPPPAASTDDAKADTALKNRGPARHAVSLWAHALLLATMVAGAIFYCTAPERKVEWLYHLTWWRDVASLRFPDQPARRRLGNHFRGRVLAAHRLSPLWPEFEKAATRRWSASLHERFGATARAWLENERSPGKPKTRDEKRAKPLAVDFARPPQELMISVERADKATTNGGLALRRRGESATAVMLLQFPGSLIHFPATIGKIIALELDGPPPEKVPAGTLFWSTTEAPGISSERAVPLLAEPHPSDSSRHLLVARLHTHPDWVRGGRVGAIRLDIPLPGSGESKEWLVLRGISGGQDTGLPTKPLGGITTPLPAWQRPGWMGNRLATLLAALLLAALAWHAAGQLGCDTEQESVGRRHRPSTGQMFVFLLLWMAFLQVTFLLPAFAIGWVRGVFLLGSGVVICFIYILLFRVFYGKNCAAAPDTGGEEPTVDAIEVECHRIVSPAGRWLGWAGWATLFLVAAAWFILSTIPEPRSPDTLEYHLPPVADAFATGRYRADPVGDGTLYPACRSSASPRGLSILTYWLVEASGSLRTASLGQWPFALLALAVLLAALDRLRIGGVARPAAAACLFLAPNMLAQLTDLYADVAFLGGLCALVLAAERWLTALEKAPATAPRHALVLGIAAGLFFSIKATALSVGGVLLLVTFVWGFAVHRRLRARSPVRIVSTLAAVALPSLALGGIYYIINLIRFRNPIYPIRLSLPGLGELPGYWPTHVNAHILSRSELTPSSALVEVLRENSFDIGIGSFPAGLGAVPALLGLPALTAALVYLLVRRDQWNPVARRWALLALVAYLVLPDRWWPRFGLWILAPCAVALGWWISRSRVWFASVILAVVLAVGAWNVWRTIPYLYGFPSTPTSLLARLPTREFDADCANLWMESPTLARVVREAPGRRVVAFVGLTAITRLAGERGNVIVRQLPNDSAERWLTAFRDEGITHVYVQLTRASDPPEVRWMKEHPERFERLARWVAGGRQNSIRGERVLVEEIWRCRE